MSGQDFRTWMVRWMYGVAVAHLIVGALLPWIGDLAVFEAYHRSIESGFWQQDAPASARAQQIWWISLFGATIQSMSLWMGVLIYLGDHYRRRAIWAWLILGLVVWAPQDMLISLRVGAWIHVWVDCLALVTMLPPLAWLWWHDSKKLQTPNQQ